MSVRSRIRKKQRRDFDLRLKFNSGPDREIGIWELIDIHQIPSKIKYENEFDFWCHNKQDLFLLKLKKTIIKKFSVKKPIGRSAMKLIVEFNFEHLGNDVIKNILDQLEKIGIPNYKVSKMNMDLESNNA